MLLALAERRRTVAKTLAARIVDPRDPAHVTHTVEDVRRARILAIACGYPDGNDFGFLRSDPAFKPACGRLPDTGADLCSSQPSRAGKTRPRLVSMPMCYTSSSLYATPADPNPLPAE